MYSLAELSVESAISHIVSPVDRFDTATDMRPTFSIKSMHTVPSELS